MFFLHGEVGGVDIAEELADESSAMIRYIELCKECRKDNISHLTLFKEGKVFKRYYN